MGNLFRTGGGGGKIKRTQIFSGDSRADHKVDLTSYDGWQNFTLANFCISNCKETWAAGSDVDEKYILSDYNQKTGILTLNKSIVRSPKEGAVYLIQYIVDLIEID